jgi:hypothetical protein
MLWLLRTIQTLEVCEGLSRLNVISFSVRVVSIQNRGFAHESHMHFIYLFICLSCQVQAWSFLASSG